MLADRSRSVGADRAAATTYRPGRRNDYLIEWHPIECCGRPGAGVRCVGLIRQGSPEARGRQRRRLKVRASIAVAGCSRSRPIRIAALPTSSRGPGRAISAVTLELASPCGRGRRLCRTFDMPGPALCTRRSCAIRGPKGRGRRAPRGMPRVRWVAAGGGPGGVQRRGERAPRSRAASAYWPGQSGRRSARKASSCAPAWPDQPRSVRTSWRSPAPTRSCRRRSNGCSRGGECPRR